MNNIDPKHEAHTGTIYSVVDTGKGRPFALINIDDEKLAKSVAKAKIAFGISQRNPERIQCVLRYDDADDFYACKGNDSVVAGDRVTFRVRNDNRGLPQAYDVKIIDAPAPVKLPEYLTKYLDPALPLPDNIEAGVSEMKDVEGFLDEEDFDVEDDEIDQDEIDYSSYYKEK